MATTTKPKPKTKTREVPARGKRKLELSNTGKPRRRKKSLKQLLGSERYQRYVDAQQVIAELKRTVGDV